MRFSVVVVALPLALALASCSKDVVLPDIDTEPVCGNGVIESGEACDVQSPGCAACVIVPTWKCSATDCAQICGDGVSGSGTTCASARRDTDCDMTGYWAGRATDYTRDTVLNGVQTSSNWWLFRFEQTGDTFQVADAIDCGTHVTGSATVDSTPGSVRALMYRNRMDAFDGRPARTGTSKAVAGGCAMTFARWYFIRGVGDGYLPADFAAKPALSTLTPLPAVKDPVVGDESPAGAVDIDGDGIPGVSFLVSGIVTGIRNSAQREWKENTNEGSAPVPAGAVSLTIPEKYDLQESVLRVSSCGTGCPLLAAGANAAQDLTGRLALTFIGKTLGSARVAEVVAAPMHQDLDLDLATCAKVRLVLPHDPSKP